MISQASIPTTEMENAFLRKDSSYDGIFFVAVKTTGIFCRPSCPSHPKRENVEFFPAAGQAIIAGYRPCKRCNPLQVNGGAPEWAAKLMRDIQAEPGKRIATGDLRKMGITPETARRWFKDHYGLTFAQWQRNRRLAEAFTQIHQGTPIDDAVFANGYQSHSGFRDAFAKTFGKPPGKLLLGQFISAQFMESPLGPLLTAASEKGICLIVFSDRRMLERDYRRIGKRFGQAILLASNEMLEKLRTELDDYFGGKLKQFTVPLDIRGTPFQEHVWRELQLIPFAETISYQQLAERAGHPSAVRAAAQATGMNPISIVIPCHRVVGKDGELTGYGGGLWRKRLLLELERKHL